MEANIVPYYNPSTGTYVGINLDELSSSDFAKIKGKLKNVRDHVLFDSIRFAGATAWAIGSNYQMFQVANGQIGSVANIPATTYVKTDADTNLVGNGGQLPSGDFFTVQSIMVKLTVPENEFTTELIGGSTINPTPEVVVTFVGGGGANQVLAMTENTTLKFWVDDTRLYENGTIDYFPQGFGLSGWNGQGAGGIAQNGGVLPRMLSRPRHLRQLQRFKVDIQNVVTMTVPLSCRLKVGLWGALYVPVG